MLERTPGRQSWQASEFRVHTLIHSVSRATEHSYIDDEMISNEYTLLLMIMV